MRLQALRQSLLSFADVIPHNVRIPDAADIEDGYRARGRAWTGELQVGLRADQLGELGRQLEINEQRLVAAGMGSPYPGMEALLSRLQREGLTLHLGADASREHLLSVSDKHRLDRHFEAMFCAGEFGTGQLWDMFEESMHRAGVHSSETVALGTRPEYFRAAHSLDVMTIGCGWGIRQQGGLAEAILQCGQVERAWTAVSRMDAHASGCLEQ